jgi:predicted nucleic acid-binding protein
MIHRAWGPFLFDTSAESWIARSERPAVKDWFAQYLSLHPVHVSAITLMERIRGYALLAMRTKGAKREMVEAARRAYLNELGRVEPVDGAVAMVAAEIMALLPHPPTAARRAHKLAESRQERLVRWRFDSIIAATALVNEMVLIHNNPADFESIRTAIETSPERFPKLGPLGLIRCESLV